MSDVRSRLGTQDIRQTTFEHERQHLFAGTRINAAYAVPLLAVVVALIAVLWISPWLVGGWACPDPLQPLPYGAALPDL